MSDESRRKLIKAIAASSGGIIAGKSLPDSWGRPIVDSVMLPAHAATSSRLYSGNNVQASLSKDSLFARVMGITVADANAGPDIPVYLIDACAPEVGSNLELTMQVIESAPNTHKYVASLPLSGTPVMVTAEDLCPPESCGTSEEMYVMSADDIEAIIQTSSFGQIIIPKAGSCVQFSLPQCPAAESDIRLKTNIETLSISRKGYNLYKFQYIDENNENTYVGVMAQDILSRNPEAVIQNEAGFYMVRYAQLGLKMVTLKQWESEGPDSVELIH